MLLETEAMGKVGCWQFDSDTLQSEWSAGIFRIYELPEDGPTPSADESINFYAPASRPVIAARLRRSTWKALRPEPARHRQRTRAVHAIGRRDESPGSGFFKTS
jgi:hypothetical protein